jgi:hypothetical protein
VVCAAIFFHLKFQILTEVPRTDVKLADRIALLEAIKNQLAEIAGMPKSAIPHVIQQQEKL